MEGNPPWPRPWLHASSTSGSPLTVYRSPRTTSVLEGEQSPGDPNLSIEDALPPETLSTESVATGPSNTKRPRPFVVSRETTLPRGESNSTSRLPLQRRNRERTSPTTRRRDEDTSLTLVPITLQPECVPKKNGHLSPASTFPSPSRSGFRPPLRNRTTPISRQTTPATTERPLASIATSKSVVGQPRGNT